MNRAIQLLLVLRAAERVHGRKKLQKLVHIIKSHGYPIGFRYSFHIHGAFSTDLKEEIDRLVSEYLVVERKESAGEYEMYVYSLDGSVGEVLSELDHESLGGYEAAVRELVGMSAQLLEAISTIFYLRDRDLVGDQLEAKFGKLKPHLIDQYSKAAAKVEELLQQYSSGVE